MTTYKLKHILFISGGEEVSGGVHPDLTYLFISGGEEAYLVECIQIFSNIMTTYNQKHTLFISGSEEVSRGVHPDLQLRAALPAGGQTRHHRPTGPPRTRNIPRQPGN